MENIEFLDSLFNLEGVSFILIGKREMKDLRKKLGIEGEEKAISYLKERGYRILERNYRFGRGEIDIIAKQGKTLVFVEVKVREGFAFGRPEEAVDWRKQRQLIKLATHYLQAKGLLALIDCRFDVIAFSKIQGRETLEHIVDAFRA